MDHTRTPPPRASSSFSHEANGRPAVLPPGSPEQGFAPYFEMNGIGGPDPRASLAFDNIEQQNLVGVHPAAPQPVPQSSLPPMHPKVTEKPRATPSPTNGSVNGGTPPVYERDSTEETVPIFGLMDRKKKMYEERSKSAYGQTKMSTPVWNGLTQPAEDKKIADPELKLKDALDYLSKGTKAIAKVMNEFEKLTGGQVGEGLLCCPITQVR